MKMFSRMTTRTSLACRNWIDPHLPATATAVNALSRRDPRGHPKQVAAGIALPVSDPLCDRSSVRRGSG